jgi:hypothetical protein
VAVLLGDQRAIHGVHLGIRVLIQHHRLRSSRIGRIKPLADGGRIQEEHGVAGHGIAQGCTQGLATDAAASGLDLQAPADWGEPLPTISWNWTGHQFPRRGERCAAVGAIHS